MVCIFNSFKLDVAVYGRNLVLGHWDADVYRQSVDNFALVAVETCRICLGSTMFFHFSRRTCYYLHHLGTSRCCAPISLVRITKIQSRVNNRYKNDKLNFKLFFFSVLKCETRIEHQNTIFKCGLDSLHTWWVFYWDIFCTKPKIIQLKSIR